MHTRLLQQRRRYLLRWIAGPGLHTGFEPIQHAARRMAGKGRPRGPAPEQVDRSAGKFRNSSPPAPLPLRCGEANGKGEGADLRCDKNRTLPVRLSFTSTHGRPAKNLAQTLRRKMGIGCRLPNPEPSLCLLASPQRSGIGALGEKRFAVKAVRLRVEWSSAAIVRRIG